MSSWWGATAQTTARTRRGEITYSYSSNFSFSVEIFGLSWSGSRYGFGHTQLNHCNHGFFRVFFQIGRKFLQTNGGLDTVGIVYLILSRCIWKSTMCLCFSCACHQLTIQATVCGHARKVDSSVGYQFRRLQQVILTGQSVVMSAMFIFNVLCLPQEVFWLTVLLFLSIDRSE